MTRYVKRDAIRIPFRDLTGVISAIDPTQLIITFEKSRANDIGALCYLRRETSTSKDRLTGRNVDLTSLNKVRIEQVSKLIEILLDSSATLRDCSINNRIHRIIYFFDWCDCNNHSSVLSNA